MRDQFRLAGVDIDQPLRQFARVRGGVADALDAGNFSDVFDDQRQIRLFFATRHRAPVGIHILAEQRHFLDPLCGQAGHLGQHVVERA